MIGLIFAELHRFASRRLFRLIGALVIAVIVASAVIAFVQSSKDPQAGVEAARRDVAACERDRERFAAETRGEVFECPSVAELANAYDKRFDYAETMPDSSRAVAVALFILSFVIAASFMGAEWGTGSMTTLLTWEPRRGRVLAAKTIAAVVALALSVAVLLAFLAVAFLPVAALRGITGGVDWLTMSGIWLRAAALAAFASATACGIATITRNTAGAIGIAFAYGIILDNLLGVIRSGRFRPWLLQHLLPRMLGLPVEVREPGQFGGAIHLAALTPVRPIILLSLYAAAVLALAYALFRARDVT